jgi:F-type H+-transporting ATPase subunit delta
MIVSEVAHRYAAALFAIATGMPDHEKYLGALKLLSQELMKDKAVHDFVVSPLIRAEQKENALRDALSGKGVDENVMNFVLLLARKGRVSLLPEVAMAYEEQVDQLNHLQRGVVRSAAVPSDKQKQELQRIIESYTRGKVVLNYQEDPALLGGLTAQVGSLTFDDSLTAHLRNIKEELDRSAQ